MTEEHDHPHPHPHERASHPKRRPHHHGHDDVTPHPHGKRPEPLHHPLEGVYADAEEPPPPERGFELPASPDVVVRAGENVAAAVANAPTGSASEPTAILLEGRFPLAAQVRVPVGKVVYAEGLGAAELVPGSYAGTAIALDGGDVLNVRAGDGLRSGVQASAGRLLGFDIFGCVENGIGSNRDKGVEIGHGEVHDNGTDAAQGHNAGGIKLTASGDRGRGAAAHVHHVKAYRNKGNGIWHDVDSGNCVNDGCAAGSTDCGSDPNVGDDFDGDFEGWSGAAIVEDVEAWENDARGIFVEVSRGPVIVRRFSTHHNNRDRLGRAAGVGVSAAKHVLITDGESFDNYGAYDVWVGQIERTGDRPWAPGYYIVRDVTVRRVGVSALSRIADNVDRGVTYTANYQRT